MWDLEAAEREAGPGRRRKVQFEGILGAEDVGMVYDGMIECEARVGCTVVVPSRKLKVDGCLSLMSRLLYH